MRFATVVLVLAGALVGGCCIPARQSDPNAPAYSAEMVVDGYTVHIDLYHNHAFLAEYRKVVQVRRGDALVASREYQDSGGLASFYLLRDGARVTVVDGLVRGFVLDTTTGTVAEVVPDAIPSDFPEQSFGRFMFVSDPKRRYRWFTREEVPDWVKR